MTDTDLNNYKTCGKYVTNDSDSYTNAPISNMNFFSLEITRVTKIGGYNYLAQTITQFNGFIFTRYYDPNANTWTNWEKTATKRDIDSIIIREVKNFTSTDPSEVLDFTNLQNGRLHIFYSAVYGARWISCKVITQYNTISIIDLERNGISVEDITSGPNMAVRFKRDSWNDYYCPIVHVII